VINPKLSVFQNTVYSLIIDCFIDAEANAAV